MNIVLIGMRGAGKSNVGRRLSVMLKRPAVSTDLMIEYENDGRSIAQIIADCGSDWRKFREMEYRVIQKLVQMDGLIIDCGGGIVVDLDDSGKEVYSSRKIDLLRQNAHIVWLKGEIPYLAAKIKDDPNRPSLHQSISPEELMHNRLEFYERAADLAVNIDGKSRKEVAKTIRRLLFPKKPE